MRLGVKKAKFILLDRLPGFSKAGDTYWGVLVFSAWYFLGIAPLDPDPHHDGVQYAAAAGVADGLHIQSQVFDQYGPTTAWIQGLTLKVFGMNLLNLRIENAFFLTICSLLLLKILLLLRLPHFVSALVCAAWVISCPVTSIPRISYGYAFWPWPSVIALLLLLANFLIILSAFTAKRHANKWEIYTLGTFCSMILFTRFQVGIVASLTASTLIAFSGLYSTNRERLVRFGAFLASFGTTTLLILCVISLQGSLDAFFGQVVTGSLDKYGNTFAWKFYEPFYTYGSIPFIVLLALSVFAWMKFKEGMRWPFHISITALLFFALYLGNVKMASWTFSADATRMTFDQLPFTFIYGSTVICGVASFIVIVKVAGQIFQKYQKKLLNRDASEPVAGNENPKIITRGLIQEKRMNLYILLTFSFAPFAVQLYPMADQMHLWWISPFLFAFFTLILRDLVDRRGLSVILASLLLPLIAASTISFLDFRSIPRLTLTNQSSAFTGMKVQYRYKPSYIEVQKILGNVLPQSAKFDCPDGLFATWTGHYLATDAKYVSWAWHADSASSVKTPTRHFICASPADAKTFATQRGYTLIEPGTNYIFGLYSSGTLFEYRINSN